MTASDAASVLGESQNWVLGALNKRALAYKRANQDVYFGHETAKRLFPFAQRFTPRVIVCHIVKGGTGKTSLVYELAIRASLYGAKVLCVDMDQQGNLTHAFNQNADALPVMIDVLVDYYPLMETIVPVLPGIDLIPSRFENAMLDEALRSKYLPLDKVYRHPLQALKNRYDVVIIDCPPSLGQSVAACVLAADYLVAPVTAERFALLGLDIAYQSLQELQENFALSIPFGIVLNKFEPRTKTAQKGVQSLFENPTYHDKWLQPCIRFSQEFPKNMLQQGSIFDTVKPTIAKADIDGLTRALLSIVPNVRRKTRTRPALFDTLDAVHSI